MSKFKTPFLPLPSFLFLLLSRVHFGDWDDDDQRCKSRHVYRVRSPAAAAVLTLHISLPTYWTGLDGITTLKIEDFC